MGYKSTRRQWVKLWVNEWLDGTTRFELTAHQRLVWVDLLALAGRSRFPGFVYAGTSEGNKRVGYPIAYLAGVLQMDEVTLNNTLKLLVEKGHITLDESTSENYIIGIVNWEKYQSEYLRQRSYRKVTTKTTNRLPVEGEKREKERENRSTYAANTAADFDAFWNSYPRKVGKKEAQKSWLRIVGVHEHVAEIIAGVERWKVNPQWEEVRFIPNPATFLNQRRWEDEVPAKMKQPQEISYASTFRPNKAVV